MMLLLVIVCVGIKVYYDGDGKTPLDAWAWYLRDQKFLPRRR